MEGYILIVLQVLFSGLIIWRIRQQNHGKAGCFAVFMTIAVVFALTTSLYFLGKSIVFDGLLSDVFADSRGSLAAASPAEWLMAGFLLLMIILIAATVCSMTGFAITGHHPHFCKMVWKTLAGILLLPIIAMALLGISFATAFCGLYAYRLTHVRLHWLGVDDHAGSDGYHVSFRLFRLCDLADEYEQE